MKKSLLVSLFIASISLSGVHQFDFEDRSIEDNGVKVSISQERYKRGGKSLKWEYDENSKLVIKDYFEWEKANSSFTHAFQLSIYNKKKSFEKLKFEFFYENELVKSFDMNLSYEGWAMISVPFSDMNGDNSNLKADTIVITAPNQKGVFYLDDLVTNIPIDSRYSARDYQIPFINEAAKTSVNKHWNAIHMYSLALDEYKYRNLGNTNKKDIEKIEQGLNEYHADLIFGPDKSPVLSDVNYAYSEEEINAIFNEIDKYKIKEEQGRILGPALIFPNQIKHFVDNRNKILSADEVKSFRNGNGLDPIGRTLLKMSFMLESKKIPQDIKAKLEEKYILMVRYIIDQGFNARNGFLSVDHMGYQYRQLLSSLYKSREILRKHNLYTQAKELIQWYSLLGRIVKFDEKIDSVNIDIFTVQALYMLEGILMEEDDIKRNDLLLRYSEWLDKSLINSVGIRGGYKEDGSMYHHYQPYVMYGISSINVVTNIVQALDKTKYQVSEKAYERLKLVLERLIFYTKDDFVPPILTGRHPGRKVPVGRLGYKYLGKALNDKYLLANYARLTNLESYMGVKANEDPSGTIAMNYSNMLVKRNNKDEKGKTNLIIIKGFSRYLVSGELYAAENRYGRYGQYGRIEIIPNDASNFDSALKGGFDWNYFPGTTSIVLPFDKLIHKGGSEMLLSSEKFSGANSLGETGIFGMKLRGTPKYNQEDFRARKSYFAINNQIIALGTGINSLDSQNRVVTTVFQQRLKDGMNVSAEGNIYKTPDGLTYYIYDGKFAFKDSLQTSPLQNARGEESGRFGLLTIEHGKAPKDATYEYVIMLKENEKPSYTVVQKDDNAHIVKDLNSNVRGYVFFEDTKSKDDLILESTEGLIIAYQNEKTLTLSVVNPDLAFYEGDRPDYLEKDFKAELEGVYSAKWAQEKSKPVTVKFILKGKWITKDNVKIRTVGDNTEIIVTTIGANPMKIELVKSE